MGPRVAILTNIPAPYRLAFFQRLSGRCDLRVIFDARSEPNRAWTIPDDLGFPHSYVRGLVIPYTRKRTDAQSVHGLTDERYLQLRYGIVPELIRFQPDLVISAELAVRSLQAVAYCALRRLPLILWSEGTLHTEGWVGSGKRMLRRVLVRRAARFWTNGLGSSQLLITYGAEERRCDPGMIGIDTDSLSRRVDERLSRRPHLRAALEATGVVFLFSGQLVPRKGIEPFLQALGLLAPRASEFSVLFLGDGPQKQLIADWADRHPQVRIRLLGFRQPDQLPEVYAAADVFVLPTLDDNWSLVALEAAVSGLPQLFSRLNGATADLLAHGAAGVSFDPRDASSFAQALATCLDHPPARLPPALTAKLIDYYGPDRCSERAWTSIQAALHGSTKLR